MIKAFTLIETVVAMLLIMLSIGLSTTLFVSIGQVKKQKEVKVLFQLQQISQQSIEQDELFDDEFFYETYLIRRKVKEYRGLENIFKLHLIAYDSESNKKVEEWRELVISN